ncbi:MAG: hypothetical protein HQL56_01105 [Magnetococcales bacterium]|nr:hypothetical protein [Magnetococcales bacterium]
MDVQQDILLRLGELIGKIETILTRQEELTKWISKLDDRLRAVEIKAAAWGAAGGGVAATAVHYIFKTTN